MQDNLDDLNFSWDQTPAPQAAAQPDAVPQDQSFDPAQSTVSAPKAAAPPEMTPSSVDPLANTPSAAGNSAATPANPYDDHLAAISSAASPDDQALARNNLMRTLYGDFQAAGHDVQWSGEQLIVDGLPYDVAGSVNPSDISAAAGHGVVGPSTATPATPNYVNQSDPVQAAVWAAFQKKGITPRDQGDFEYWVNDINNSPGGWNNPDNRQYWLDRMANTTQGGVGDYAERPEAGGAPSPMALSVGDGGPAVPGPESLPSVAPYTFSYDSLMQSDPIEQQTNANLSSLLANPESMDPHTVDVMKASAKNELTDAQQQEEADIVNLGYQGGIGESPWTQAQRLNSRFGRDVALSKSNTNIDIQAAQSRVTDQRAAIDEGLKYAAQRQDKVAFAEQAKQKAAELGISEQQVIAQYTLGTIDAQLKKYGMNLDAELAKQGFQIDWAKIDQANTQFLMDLGFKYSNLNEQASEFDASH